MANPRALVKLAAPGHIPQMRVSLAAEGERAQCTYRVATAGETAQMTIAIAEDGDRAQQRAIVLGLFDPAAYIARIVALAPIAYYPLDESSGTTAIDQSGNGHNGTYSGAVPGGDGIGSGQTGASFDGSLDTVNIAAMRTLFNGNTGSLVVWGKTSAWADATVRFLARIQVNASNQVNIQKTANLNEISFNRSGGGTPKSVVTTALAGSPAYFCAGMTWDTGADELKAYLNGVQVGATQTGIGTFTGTVGLTTCALGAGGSTGASCWSGGVAHGAVWNRALSAAEMVSAGVP